MTPELDDPHVILARSRPCAVENAVVHWSEALKPLSVGLWAGKRFHHCLSVPRKHDDLGESAHVRKYPAQARFRRTVFAGHQRFSHMPERGLRDRGELPAICPCRELIVVSGSRAVWLPLADVPHDAADAALFRARAPIRETPSPAKAAISRMIMTLSVFRTRKPTKRISTHQYACNVDR